MSTLSTRQVSSDGATTVRYNKGRGSNLKSTNSSGRDLTMMSKISSSSGTSSSSAATVHSDIPQIGDMHTSSALTISSSNPVKSL